MASVPTQAPRLDDAPPPPGLPGPAGQQDSPCASDAECFRGRFCVNSVCVDCRNDSDCIGFLGVCSSGGECVECASDSDCPGSEVCFAGSCSECASDSDCSGNTPNCVNGYCSECNGNADCGGSTPFCQILVNAPSVCVQCQSDSDCSGGTPYCGSQRSCVSCVFDSHCPSSAPYCLAFAGGVCSACITDAECSGGQFCSIALAGCVDCRSDGDCSGGQFCVNGNCVACRSDGDCSAGQFCVVGSCVECRSAADCPAGQFCSAGRCVDCRNEGDCPSGQFCVSNDCVQCRGDGDCTSGFPFCDAGTCVACRGDGDCPQHFTCIAGACVGPPLPAAPRSVSVPADKIRATEAIVEWVPGGALAVGWRISAEPMPGPDAPPLPTVTTFAGAAAMMALLVGLEPDTDYEFCVAGRNIVLAEGPQLCAPLAKTDRGFQPLSEAIETAAPTLGRPNIRGLAAAAEGHTGVRPVPEPELPPGALRYMRNVMRGRSANMRAPSTLSPDEQRVLNRSFRRSR